MTRTIAVLVFLLSIVPGSYSQVKDSLHYKTIAASPTLANRSAKWQKDWGTNRRAEWSTPVTVPIARLDTLYGGLKVVEVGGGNETRSLQLQTPSGKQYAMRSINKSRNDVIEDRFRGNIVEEIILDGVSSSYPYGAFVIPYMQEKAGLLHAKPVLFYVPQQPALDTLNARFGNDLYLIEQRPDGDWSDAPNFGNLKDFSSTEKLMKKMLEENDHRPDQYSFIKARLFDMLIGDWDRHAGNWRWGKKEGKDVKLYIPIARDRDQAFYTHNGKLLDKFLPMSGFAYMQNFDSAVANISTLNKPERAFDHFFASEMDRDDWLRAATELQQALTDDVIRRSVMGLPPEIYAISGEELISKLISRRNQLPRFAEEYYSFIATETEITGSGDREFFDVQRSDSFTTVEIYRIKKKVKETKPFYKRVFKTSETKEIRLYGIGEKDVYSINGHSAITLRIIGGPGIDSVHQSGSRVHIYDNRNNTFNTSSVKWHLSSDSAVHKFVYGWHPDNTKGFSFITGYDRGERGYAGLGFASKTYRWRKEPFASSHRIGVFYTFPPRAMQVGWKAIFPQQLGKWGIVLNAWYDIVAWRNFYGLGNSSIRDIKKRKYYLMQNSEWMGSIGLQREFGNSLVEFAAFYDHFDLRDDTTGYLGKEFIPATSPKVLESDNYAGLRLTYSYLNVNDANVPTKGFTFMAKVLGANDFEQDEFFQNYTARIQGYLPLSKKFSLAIRAGGMTVSGKANVFNTIRPFRHVNIGGPESLRGYPLERFWGQTALYTMSELRFITPMRSRLLNADIGILGFIDNGRVWMPNDASTQWQTGYGGGILLAPFRAISFQATYGVSTEAKLVQFRINTLL